VGKVQLAEIRATSPTLVEVMRSCLLRAGLSRASGASAFALGSPRAWLGTAYHEVLEKIPEVDPSAQSLDHALDRLWADAIARQHERANDHPLDRRFGLPATWPGYYLAEASVRLRAQELVTQLAHASPLLPGPTRRLEDAPRAVREQQLVACGGKLVGRPDLIRDGEVVDYKSGEILEYDEEAQTDAVKEAYVRQLRIYRYLVKEEFGWWPRRGVLLPLAGPAVEVGLDPVDCEREAAEAVALLDKYNQKLEAGAGAKELASPSPAACKWCQYKLICPAFWPNAATTWSGQLDGGAVEGTLFATPRPTHGGEAFAISLDVEAGSEVRCRTEIAPLNPDVHSSITTMGAGARLRIVGLRIQAEGSLIPGQRTLLARVDDLPQLSVESEQT